MLDGVLAMLDGVLEMLDGVLAMLDVVLAMLQCNSSGFRKCLLAYAYTRLSQIF